MLRLSSILLKEKEKHINELQCCTGYLLQNKTNIAQWCLITWFWIFKCKSSYLQRVICVPEGLPRGHKNNLCCILSEHSIWKLLHPLKKYIFENPFFFFLSSVRTNRIRNKCLENREVFKTVVVSIVLIITCFRSVSDPLPPRYITTLARLSGQGYQNIFLFYCVRGEEGQHELLTEHSITGIIVGI